MNKLSEFLGMLDKQIKFFRNEAEKHKKIYRRSRYAVAILGAVSSVLAATSIWQNYDWIKVAVVVTSSASGVIAFREGLRKPYELWMNERATSHRLLDLKREAKFYLDDTSSIKEVEKYFKDMQQLVIASGETWEDVVSSANTDSTSSGS